MQVLAWQCRMLRKHALEYENVELGEDVAADLELSSTMLPGGLHTSHGGSSPPPLTTDTSHQVDQAGLVLAGFRDCSEEAIRYLIDVEHLPEDDPLILGLKQHLWERQQQLDIERIISEHMCWSADPVMQQQQQYQFLHHQHQQQQDIARTDPTSFLYQQQSQNFGASSDASLVQHPFDISGGSSASLHSDIHMCEDDDLNRSADSEKTDLNQSSSSTSSSSSLLASQHSSSSVITPASHHVLPLHQNPSEAPISNTSDTEMSQSVLNLALLAQNNPAIASLTEELLSLLTGDEQHDSDLESDLDFEESRDSD